MVTRYIAIDVETTGFSVTNGDRVIEVGAVAIEEGKIVAELATLIDVAAPISPGAFRVHGISAAMLAGKPSPANAWSRFKEFVGAAPLVAHNAPFDSSFVRHELALLNLEMSNRWHCTVRLSRSRFPHLANHRLETVYRYLFGCLPEGIERHRALDDARLAAKVWIVLEGR